MEPVAELMDEHFALLEISDEVRRSLAAQDRGEGRRLLERAGRMLARHVSREEAGIFAALEEQGDFVDAVRELEAEHVDFDRQLACLDDSTPDFAAAVHRLRPRGGAELPGERTLVAAAGSGSGPGAGGGARSGTASAEVSATVVTTLAEMPDPCVG